MTRDLKAAGFETAVALEIDRDCCETIGRNGSWTVIDRSIFDVRSDEILEAARLKRGQAAVLVGGPSCQPFSKAGYWVRGESKRLDDPRANTLSAYMRVLEDTLPAVFLLENVEGLAYARKSEGLELLLALVADINCRAKTHYRPSFQVVKAADYGVPQLRERFIMVAARDGCEFRFPSPVYGPIETRKDQLTLGNMTPYRSAWDALGDDDSDPSLATARREISWPAAGSARRGPRRGLAIRRLLVESVKKKPGSFRSVTRWGSTKALDVADGCRDQ